MQDPYEALGVGRGASLADIKAAYRKGCSEWHPDRHKVDDREEANRRMQEINDAYAILSDPARRARFDASGDTSPRGRLVENARAILANAFSSIVDQVDAGAAEAQAYAQFGQQIFLPAAHPNPITQLTAQLEAMKRQGFADRQTASQRARFLERKLKALKGPADDNFLAPVIQGKIDAQRRAIASIDEAIEAFGIALEIVKGYAWALEADPEAGLAQFAGLLNASGQSFGG